MSQTAARADGGHLQQQPGAPSAGYNPRCPCPNCRLAKSKLPPGNLAPQQQQMQQAKPAAAAAAAGSGADPAKAGDKPRRQVFSMKAAPAKPLFKTVHQAPPSLPKAPKAPKEKISIKIKKQLARLVKRKKE